MKRPVFLSVVTLCAVLSGAGGSARGAEPQPAPPQPGTQNERMMGLARSFLDRIGAGFERADRYMQALDPADFRMQKAFASIEDGEPLILQIKLGKLMLSQPVNAIKQGQDVMVSLTDFVAVAHFSIAVDAQAGKADGWYRREDQPFHLDLNAKTAAVNKKNFPVGPGESLVQDGDIYVKGATLSQWFGFYMTVDVGQQNLLVTAPEKWPVEEKFERDEKRKERTASQRKGPELPRLNPPYEMASVPRADVSLTQFYDKTNARTPSASALPQMRSAYSVQTAGDFARHTVRTSVSGTSENKLENVRVNFSRSDEDPVLLGRLKARHYEFGDVSTVPAPNLGPAPSEIGVRVMNSDPFSTTGTTIQITGDGKPGYDVEVYRNDQYVAAGEVDENGRYRFDDVFLFAGDNRFRIVQYGPLGEIIEENRTYTATANLPGGEKGLYDVSLSAQNTQAYSARVSRDLDKNTPHAAAVISRQISPALSVYGATQLRQENETPKAWVSAGATTSVKGAILNADVAADATGSSYYGSLTARRNLADQEFAGSAVYRSPNFNPGGGDATQTPSSLAFNMLSSGPVPWFDRNVFSYQAGSSYIFLGDGSTQFGNTLDTTLRAGRVSFTGSLSRSVLDNDSGTFETFDASLGARGKIGKTRLRTVASYGLKPVSGLKEVKAAASRPLTKDLDGNAEVRYRLEDNYTQGKLALDWAAKHFNLTPSVQYDTNQALSAQVNMRFGLTRDPADGSVLMTNAAVSGTGGILAKVFLDRDGNGVFSSGDEWLEGVVVESVQNHKEAVTDKTGQAFLYDLPSSRVTDIDIQEGGDMDPSWISGFPGVSIRPRPGHVETLSFPVLVSGEMDGTIYAGALGETPARPLSGMHIALYDGDGRRAMDTLSAPDGYFYLTRIPPGDYYVIVDGKDMKSRHVASGLPEKIHIGYEGTVIDGKDIVLNPEGAGAEASYSFAPDLKSYADANEAGASDTLRGAQYVLNLGDYQSRLLAALTWYTLKTRYGALLGGAKPVVPVSRTNPAADTGMNTLRIVMPGVPAEEAYRRCGQLVAAGQRCTFEMLPGAELGKQASVQ